MAFHWRGDTDAPGAYRSQDFPTRVDAEAWLTETYPDLLDEGVRAVTLLEDDSIVYGPMSLEP
nr:hypothetical protein [Propionibacterium sp.]